MSEFDLALDKAVHMLASSVALNHKTTLVGYQEKRKKEDVQVANAVTAIKRVLDKYVIGDDLHGPIDDLSSEAARYEYRDELRDEQRKSLMSEPFNSQWEVLLEEALTQPTGSRWRSLFKPNRQRPMVEPQDWSKERALGALSIQEVPFDGKQRKLSGYCSGNELAINPRARDPFHTLIHEMAHIVLRHSVTASKGKWDEFSAEATAYVVMHDLEVEDQMDLPVSRLLLQHMVRNEMPDSGVKRSIFSATLTIIDAGRLDDAKELK
jgi:hypothetical protein